MKTLRGRLSQNGFPVGYVKIGRLQIGALTILQYVNYKNVIPLGGVKYALA